LNLLSLHKIHRYALLLIGWLIMGGSLHAQQPFECLGQMFVVTNSQSLISLSISPQNNALNQSIITPSLPNPISTLGFRRTDGLLYGIGTNDQRLYRMDATGIQEELGALGLNDNLSYLAGEITPDGQYFVLIASNGLDNEFVKIDLANNFAIQSTPITSTSLMTDISFDPHTGQLFGFDSNLKRIVSINANNGTATALPAIDPGNEIDAIFFNAFGDLKGFGTTLGGLVSAIFDLDKTTGSESLFTTTGLLSIEDMAACPYNVQIRNAVNPLSTFPCSDITFTYQIANASQSQVSEVELTHELPSGFKIINTLQNSFGGIIDAGTPDNLLKISDMNISTGVKNMIVNVYVDDIAGGNYKTKVQLDNLPPSMGISSVSDDPNTSKFGDSTEIKINRIDEDSIYYDLFLCQGGSAVLDASDFGNNLQWDNGSTQSQLTVDQTGIYSLEAVSGCQSIFVSYNLVAASCPYTIELGHSIIPDTVFPCSEVIFRYYLDNDSGEPRYHVSFLDTLPANFSFIELLPNPYGGTIKSNLPPNVVAIDGINLLEGLDSFDILVEIGDTPPGTYFNGAVINNLPWVLGASRYSDDPNTQVVDDTRLVVQGVASDTSYFDTVFCSGEKMVLDASAFGKSFVWPDGSTEAVFVAPEMGIYEVQIFDGCEPSLVYFDVQEGTPIQVSTTDPMIGIHQGESILLSPTINNGGDSLLLSWNDPLDTTLSCCDCAAPLATPLSSTVYTFMASNELCTDSLLIQVEVDDTRRIFAPNIFSPNADGINDYFFLQSPDPGIIHSLLVVNRWGDIIFQTNTAVLNTENTGWDGFFKGKLSESGLYSWLAEIEFVDGKREVFKGGVIVLR
jgi:gliding motility-associated-like protein